MVKEGIGSLSRILTVKIIIPRDRMTTTKCAILGERALDEQQPLFHRRRETNSRWSC